ncbi:MAG: GNAT family N-acetyltransferase [Planctomycetaceae bacterium]|nr:GNAT family N-acetyltransferase [Planctomycetaceae bacterium]MCB9951253.1 GNAT family N-acetyltransferase [Planctomycetaceae bacterium]
MAAVLERIDYRPIQDSDRQFLFTLYASTREEELRPVPWSAEDKVAFLKMQFEAQHSHYMKEFTSAAFDVIELDGQAIGRLYLDRWDDQFRIIDIAILPTHRGQGIGGQIMQSILDEAASAGKPVTIHVEGNNPAQRLYKRLGFKKVDDTGIYHLMRWDPPNAASDN